MSKIRRVSELKEIPGYISASFFGEEEKTGSSSRSAALKEQSAQRKAAIAKEQRAWEEERSSQMKRNSWEREVTASKYEDDGDSMEQFLNHFNGRIRRASYDVDDYDQSYRPSPTDWMNDPENYYNAGGGIFGDLESAVAQGMQREIDMRVAKAQSLKGNAREEARQDELRRKHKGVLRERQEVLAHANPLLAHRGNAVFRTGTDDAIGSSFGMHNLDAIDARERQRVKMAENKRQERLKIRREGGVEIDTHKDWEDNIKFGRSSYQDADLGWVDFMVHGNGK